MDVQHIEVKVWSERLKDKTLFHLTVAIQGNITEPQRARMLQIGRACPIHKVLTDTVEVDVNLA
jgi:putative redox protein